MLYEYILVCWFFFFQILISSEWRRKKVAGQWQKGECECVMIGCSYFCFIMLFLIINNLFLIMNTYISFASSLLFFGYKSLGFPLIMVDQLFLFSNWANAAGVGVHFYLWSTTSLHFPHLFSLCRNLARMFISWSKLLEMLVEQLDFFMLLGTSLRKSSFVSCAYFSFNWVLLV